MKSFLSKLCAVLALGFITAGCVDGLINHPNGFTIEAPTENSWLYQVDIASTEISIKYTKTPNIDKVNIYLNGNEIEDKFDVDSTPDYITANLDDLRDFLKQGKNVISIDPVSLTPINHIFFVDSEGPTVVIYGTAESGGTVTVNGKFRDASEVTSLTLNGQSATVVNDFFTVAVPAVANTQLYSFIATDEHGYSKTSEYAPRGRQVNPILDVRVSENFLEPLLPVIEDGVAGFSDIKDDGDPGMLDSMGIIEATANVIISLDMDITIEELRLQNMRFNELSISDSGNFYLDILAYPEGRDPNDPDFIATSNGGIDDGVNNINEIGVYVDLFIDAGLATIEMTLEIESMDIVSEANFSQSNGGDLNVELIYDDPKLVLDFHDMNVPQGDVRVCVFLCFNIPLAGIFDSLLSDGTIHGMMVDIVQSALDQNLADIKFPFNFYKQFDADADADFGFALLPYEASLDPGYSGSDDGNMNITYDGTFQSYTQVAGVNPVLGSYYVDNSSLPGVADSPGDDTALAVSVSSNMVNQLMLALYESGMMHFSLFFTNGGFDDLDVHLTLDNDFEAPIFFGPNVTDAWGVKDDVRITLTPTSPPQFSMLGDDTEQATLRYYGARMEIDHIDCDTCDWSNLFTVDIDIEAGVLMKVTEENTFAMTINGIPKYELNDVETNIKPPFDLLFSDTILTLGLDAILQIAIPEVAETALSIDVKKMCELTEEDYQEGDFCWSDVLSTEEVKSSNGHLTFTMGADSTP